MLYLSRFNFTLSHVLRIKTEKADKLSKRPDLKVGIENNNENQKLIKEKWIREIIEIVVEELEEVIKKKIKEMRGKNKKVVKMIEEMKIGVRNLKEDK